VRESPVKTQLQEHLPSPIKSLRQLAEAEQSCTRCPLYRDATQAAPGEGPIHAPFMLIGVAFAAGLLGTLYLLFRDARQGTKAPKRSLLSNWK
jgi:hypothetical protein